MIKNTLIPRLRFQLRRACAVFACLIICAIRANELAIDQDQIPLPTKTTMMDTIRSQNLSPRELQILANTFYWSHRYKQAEVAALKSAKKNAVLAHNILFMTYNLEYAHDDRVATVFNECHEVWKNAHMMKNAQNACVGILSFKQEINDLANNVLTCMCTDSLNALRNNKETVLDRAQQIDALQTRCAQETAQQMPALQAFYADLESQDLNVAYPSIQNVQKNIQNLTYKHFVAAHTLHDMHADITITMEDLFAQEFLEWYRFIYSLMEERKLLDTPFGTIMCDQNGLIEEECRTQLPRIQ